jgi:gas vesicle protein
MNETTLRSGHYPFVSGLFAGTLVGAALAIWLAPRASEKYRQATTRVAGAVDDLTQRGHEVRDDIAGAVARGAHEVARGAHEVAHGALEVERVATAARRPRAVEAKPPV